MAGGRWTLQALRVILYVCMYICMYTLLQYIRGSLGAGREVDTFGTACYDIINRLYIYIYIYIYYNYIIYYYNLSNNYI